MKSGLNSMKDNPEAQKTKYTLKGRFRVAAYIFQTWPQRYVFLFPFLVPVTYSMNSNKRLKDILNEYLFVKQYSLFNPFIQEIKQPTRSFVKRRLHSTAYGKIHATQWVTPK